MDDRGALGDFIRRARTRRRVSQSDLASASGVKRDYIGSIELGRIRVLYPETFRRLKEVLGFPGWAALEAMGFETDIETRPVSPKLLLAISELDGAAQEALATFIRTLELPRRYPDEGTS